MSKGRKKRSSWIRRHLSKWRYFWDCLVDKIYRVEVDTSDPWVDDPYEDRWVTDSWTETIAAYRRSGGKCGICGKPVDLSTLDGPEKPSIDHIIPLSKNGADTRKNIQLAHLICNMRKGNRILDASKGERIPNICLELSDGGDKPRLKLRYREEYDED